jgi:hypothetical protein
MSPIKEIVDSKTDNNTSENTIYSGCGVVDSKDATAPIFPTVAELRKSQAEGNTLAGTQPGDEDSSSEEPTIGNPIPYLNRA